MTTPGAGVLSSSAAFRGGPPDGGRAKCEGGYGIRGPVSACFATRSWLLLKVHWLLVERALIKAAKRSTRGTFLVGTATKGLPAIRGSCLSPEQTLPRNRLCSFSLEETGWPSHGSTLGDFVGRGYILGLNIVTIPPAAWAQADGNFRFVPFQLA